MVENQDRCESAGTDGPAQFEVSAAATREHKHTSAAFGQGVKVSLETMHRKRIIQVPDVLMHRPFLPGLVDLSPVE
ncbi:MAG TPA: hypothetical protein VM223_22575 [Planctomycetota bacterium]|nr:hypothetical protein [Planctomycetota bacterium]